MVGAASVAPFQGGRGVSGLGGARKGKAVKVWIGRVCSGWAWTGEAV